MNNIKKSTKYLIVLWLIVMMFSSCYTVQELTMSDNKRATKCNWVNR